MAGGGGGAAQGDEKDWPGTKSIGKATSDPLQSTLHRLSWPPTTPSPALVTKCRPPLIRECLHTTGMAQWHFDDILMSTGQLGRAEAPWQQRDSADGKWSDGPCCAHRRSLAPRPLRAQEHSAQTYTSPQYTRVRTRACTCADTQADKHASMQVCKQASTQTHAESHTVAHIASGRHSALPPVTDSPLSRTGTRQERKPGNLYLMVAVA